MSYQSVNPYDDKVLKVFEELSDQQLEAGKSVAARAGQNLNKSTMELGGSDAFIVLENADLDKTVEWAVWAKMNNTGQCCVAAKRFIVVEELADRFLAKFQTALAALKPGDPMDEATTLGPLSMEAALLKLLDQVERAVAGGATLVMGGKRFDLPGSFMQPTILVNIQPGNPAFREEFFGPVALARSGQESLARGLPHISTNISQLAAARALALSGRAKAENRGRREARPRGELRRR
jgi:acyl-CoA reductase-like NAD-dependent aldehyde dehydrogenase